MNKQKKRAISRGKFKRVRRELIERDGDNNTIWVGYGMCVASNGFFYWQEMDMAGDWHHFRKSITEALK